MRYEVRTEGERVVYKTDDFEAATTWMFTQRDNPNFPYLEIHEIEEKYDAIWGSDDVAVNGIYHGDRMIADWRDLAKHGLTSFDVAGWDDERLERFCKAHLT